MLCLKVFFSVVMIPVIGRKCPIQMYQKRKEKTSCRPFINSSTGQAVATFYQVHETCTTHKSAISRQKLILKLVVLSSQFFCSFKAQFENVTLRPAVPHILKDQLE